MAKRHPPRVKTHDRALVVLGAPRSGTTLIATALGAHPEIAMLSEDCDGSLFTFVGGKLPAVKLCVPVHVDLDRRWHPLYESLRWVRWLRHNFNYRLPRSRLSLRDMAARAEIRALCILRDPASNMAAIHRRAHRSDRICRDILDRTYRLYERLAGEPGIEAQFLSFERFVGEPEAQLRRLCAWLGLPFDPAMLEAPRLNPDYPEETFRADKAVTPPSAPGAPPDAALRTRYEALLARAL